MPEPGSEAELEVEKASRAIEDATMNALGGGDGDHGDNHHVDESELQTAINAARFCFCTN